MPYPATERLSTNRSAEPANEQRGVIFHDSGLSFEETIARAVKPGAAVSYHCVIAPDGSQCTLVPDAQVARHAGVSTFLGRSGCDACTLGVAFAGDTNASPLSSHQLASAVEWLARRWKARGWTPESVTDHRQASGGREKDLNPVEWARLKAALSARFAP